MYYTNSMKLTLKNEETAAAALEILKNRLTAGFDCDKQYRRNPSLLMLDNLDVENSTIDLPEDFGCYLPSDAEQVISELMQHLAAQLANESFTFNTCNSSDYDEGWVDGSYANGELKIRTTYLPSGFGDFYCPECDEVVATMTDDADGNITIECQEDVCSACGEEIDLSDWMPVITEKTFQIV